MNIPLLQDVAYLFKFVYTLVSLPVAQDDFARGQDVLYSGLKPAVFIFKGPETFPSIEMRLIVRPDLLFGFVEYTLYCFEQKAHQTLDVVFLPTNLFE